MTGAPAQTAERKVLVWRGRDRSDRALFSRTLDQLKPDLQFPLDITASPYHPCS